MSNRTEGLDLLRQTDEMIMETRSKLINLTQRIKQDQCDKGVILKDLSEIRAILDRWDEE